MKRLLFSLLALSAACTSPEPAPAPPADSVVETPAEPAVETAAAPVEAPVEAIQEAIQEVGEPSVKPGLNDRFLADDLDVDQFVKMFEGESREIAARRDAIVDVLGLRPGMQIADVGAGTGLFLDPFSEAVGPEGRLYAVDISPGFMEHLRQRQASEGLENVEPVLCTDHSAELPDASVDLIFVCDTYHHFEYPQSTLASLYSALRPGGTLVVIDFERIPGVSRDWLLDHVRAGKEVFTAEITAAGFVLEEELDAGLAENYVLRFRRP